MATLTETAAVARKGVIATIVLVITLIVARIVYTVGQQVYIALNPPPCPPATVRYGKLPALVFPPDDADKLEYKLETKDGQIPSFAAPDSRVARVYFVSSKKSNLLALDRAKDQAASLGFKFEPTQVNDTEFRWDRTDPLPARLQLDIESGSFTMDVDWEVDPGFLRSTAIPNQQTAVNEAKSVLKKAGFLFSDLESGENKVTLLVYKGGDFAVAPSLSEANFVMVDLFRAPIQQKISTEGMTPEQARCVGDYGSGMIMPPNANKGIARLLLSGSNDQNKKFVSIDYKHTQIEYDQFETYPIITGSEAWKKLISGQGHVAAKPSSGKAVVRRVDFGYYDALDSSNYLQPIYIFSGDDFVGYVPAIADGYVQTE